MDLITIAIFTSGALAVILPPIISSNRIVKLHAKERLIDLERQDQVAGKAKETAELLSQAQQLTIQKTDEVAVKVEETTNKVQSQLAQIHTLVNSNLTAALQGELDQTKRSLILLEKIEALTKGKSSLEELDIIIQTKNRIKELEENLSERTIKTELADKEKT